MKKSLLYTSDDKTFEKKTGKAFSEWEELLEEWRAEEKGHTRSVEHLQENYELSEDWARAVATRYEKTKFLKA